MYGRGNNIVGGEHTGFSPVEPPVDSVPRARSDIVDYRLRNNNSTGVGSDYNSDNQGLSQQSYYHPDQQYQQVKLVYTKT